MTVREKWSSRELERQLRLARFEQTILHPQKASAALKFPNSRYVRSSRSWNPSGATYAKWPTASTRPKRIGTYWTPDANAHNPEKPAFIIGTTSKVTLARHDSGAARAGLVRNSHPSAMDNGKSFDAVKVGIPGDQRHLQFQRHRRNPQIVFGDRPASLLQGHGNAGVVFCRGAIR